MSFHTRKLNNGSSTPNTNFYDAVLLNLHIKLLNSIYQIGNVIKTKIDISKYSYFYSSFMNLKPCLCCVAKNLNILHGHKYWIGNERHITLHQLKSRCLGWFMIKNNNSSRINKKNFKLSGHVKLDRYPDEINVKNNSLKTVYTLRHYTK